MKQGLSLEQRQTLSLSQELIQSLQILALPTSELRESILKELEENPTLEISKDSLSNNKNKRRKSKNYEQQIRKQNSSADDYQSFLESIPDKRESLQSHLLKQIQLQKLSKSEVSFAKLLIQNLDSSGFSITNPLDLGKLYNDNNSDKKISSSEIEKLVSIIQGLEPIGCCTDNTMQSLKVQAKMLFSKKAKKDKIYFFLIDLLENHAELFKLGNKTKFFQELRKINSEYKKLSYDDVKNILELISTLHPEPGKLFSSDDGTIYAIPEVFVFKTDEGFKAEVNNMEIPRLEISKIFTDNAEKSSEELKSLVQKAKQFIESLNYRREAILKVSTAILFYQKDFFSKGPKYLVPLKQSDIANELNLSASSVSRTVNGKYLQCDWGIFELKYFFSTEVSSFGKSADRNLSKNAVKDIIKTIIEEDPKITDAKISKKLKLKGINLSRRTVNKYRNEGLS